MISEDETEEDIDEMEQCLEDMEVDNEMLVLQESLAPIQRSAIVDIDTESHTDEDNMQNPASHEVRKEVEGKVTKYLAMEDTCFIQWQPISTRQSKIVNGVTVVGQCYKRVHQRNVICGQLKESHCTEDGRDA